MEPLIDDIHGESPLLTFEKSGWQEALAHFPVQPFTTSAADFHAHVQTFGELHDSPIQIRHAHFQAMRHRELVSEHQQFVRQRGSDFEVLEAAEFVQILRFPQKCCPRFHVTEGICWRPAAKQPGYPFGRREREDMLESCERILDPERVNASFRGFIARQPLDGRPDRLTDRVREHSPRVAVMDTEVALVAAEQLIGSLADEDHLDVFACSSTHEVHRHDRR